MDYLERLIRRALVVPREHAGAVFDPFEQVAPWRLDAPAQADPVVSALTRAHASANALVPSARSITPVLTRSAQPAGLAPGVVRAGLQPATVENAATASDITLAPTPLRAEPPAPERVPLGQADAFMRGLGVRALAPEALAAAHPRFDTDAQTAPQPRSHPTSRRAPQPAAPLEAVHPASASPVLARPVAPPSVSTAQTVTPAMRPPPTATSEKDALSASPRRAATDAPPQRGVQSTAVVAPSPRRLDELAHSSGISRFGIGQS